MEERLERDKMELKLHIDSAEQRLDQKVQNLERRTEVRLSQLKLHHQHLAQWLRGENPLTRARSLDMLDDKSLLDEKLENCCLNPIDDQRISSRLDHRSLDDLCSDYHDDPKSAISKDNIGEFWKNQFSQKDNVSKHRGSGRDKPKCPDLLSSTGHKGISPEKQTMHDSKCPIPQLIQNVPVPKSDAKERRLPEWRRHELRKSVHEIVSRIQASQRKPTSESREEGEGREGQWCSGEGEGEVEGWRGGVSSDSSDGEECERAGSWQEVRRLPYRSRSAVYSPTLDRDQNDSGYSTKICSNSQGPSPSLSGTYMLEF